MRIMTLALGLALMVSGCATTPPPAPAPASAAYFALGTEPFWNLEVTPERLRFHGVDMPAIDVPNPGERSEGGQRIITTRALSVRIVPDGECSDGMSERSYADSVSVRIGNGPTHLNGCGGAVSEPRGSALDRSSWRITHINGRPALADVEADLAFAEGRVSGTAGCNRLSGSFTQQRASLSFGELAMTRMACMGPRGEQEAAVTAILRQPLTIRFGERMTMIWTAADGRTMALRRLDWD
jgi:heat shock protein HslJ